MSHDKHLKQMQRHHTWRVIENRVYQWNHYPLADKRIKPSNRWNKRNPFNCGNARCFLCCNPRRISGRQTINELRANQTLREALQYIR